MLDMIFGFNLRIGRLRFFLCLIAFCIVSIPLMLVMVFCLYRSYLMNGMRPPVEGWPALAITGFYCLGTYILASMRFRDIGWDPVIIVPSWFVFSLIDALVAGKLPALAPVPRSQETIVGCLVDLVLTGMLLFWPGKDQSEASLRFENLATEGSTEPVRVAAPVLAERIAKASGQFGRRG